MGEYRLDLLGWFQFERLCQTLLTVPYGLAIEAWGGSHGLGRDAYTEDSLRLPDPKVDESGGSRSPRRSVRQWLRPSRMQKTSRRRSLASF